MFSWEGGGKFQKEGGIFPRKYGPGEQILVGGGGANFLGHQPQQNSAGVCFSLNLLK